MEHALNPVTGKSLCGAERDETLEICQMAMPGRVVTCHNCQRELNYYLSFHGYRVPVWRQ